MVPATVQLVGFGGRPAVVKAAPPGPGAEALAREAALLRAAAHPGVVEVLAAERLPGGGFELTLAYAGPRTAAGVRLRPGEAAAVAAALATTVADLHALGVRHGRIRPEHVVLDAAGRPVLCGFGGAGRAGEPGAPDPADDVAGVGEVVRALAGPDTAAEPIPAQRLARTPWDGAVARALLTLADQATHDDPARRPTAAALAAALAELVPDTAAPRRRSLLPPAAAAALLLAAALSGWAVLGWGGGGARGAAAAGAPPPPAAAALGDHDERDGAGDQRAPARAAEPAARPARTDRRAAPNASATSSSTTTTAVREGTATGAGAGRVVEHAGTRYVVGEPGDVVAVADWDCDGEPTPAAVRPATGEVFVFGSWARPGADVVVGPVAVVPGALAVEPAGCGALAVLDADGARHEVGV